MATLESFMPTLWRATPFQSLLSKRHISHRFHSFSSSVVCASKSSNSDGNESNGSEEVSGGHGGRKRSQVRRAKNVGDKSASEKVVTNSEGGEALNSEKLKPKRATRAKKQAATSADASMSASDSESELESSNGIVASRRRRKSAGSSEEPAPEPTFSPDEKYGWPPLIVCMGECLPDFIPCVRQNQDPDRQDDSEVLNTWRSLQWSPPEFARTPGGPCSNVAIALARLDARVGMVSLLGDDPEGRRLKQLLWDNRVMVDGVTLDPNLRTAVSSLRVQPQDSRQGSEPGFTFEYSVPSASDSISLSHFDPELLEEASVVFVSSLSLLQDPSRSTVIASLQACKDRGSTIVLGLNLPLYVWSSLDEALQVLRPAWLLADVIIGSQPEVEFLISEDYFVRRRYAAQQYSAQNQEVHRALGDILHYEREEVEPLMTPNVRLLVATNGTWSVHYFTREFDGYVAGAEDVLLSAYHCDRTGSGDAIMAAFLSRLALDRGILDEEEKLRKAIRFAISAGIISQWVTGAIESFPTENAVYNMAGQIYNFSNI